MLTMTLTTTCLGRIGVAEREEKGRASDGAAGGAAEGESRAGETWQAVGAVAAEVVARCQTGNRRRERHAPAPLPTGTPR